jgi:hypothetical protein
VQDTLGLVSCGWYQPAGQSSHFSIPRDGAIFPLEQTAQNVDLAVEEYVPAAQS